MAFPQLVDMQIFAAPRIVLKPLVPTFPCFGSVVVSLMEKVKCSANLTELSLYDVMNGRSINFEFHVLTMKILYLQPHVDFGLNFLGGDIMAIPNLYQYIQVDSPFGLQSSI